MRDEPSLATLLIYMNFFQRLRLFFIQLYWCFPL
ncbi:MAG: hypothetical protein ACI9S6_000254 [Reinekea sp.]